ncbi:hypothetical protein ACLMJK_007769 [Lecanora helva]
MATGPRKRRSRNRVYETEDNINQIYFPAPRRTIREKHPIWSAPSKYQQTITQMNPFHAIFHPELEDDSLELDVEEPQEYVASPKGRKRRKTTLDSPSLESPSVRKIATRSSARTSIKTEQNEENIKREFPIYVEENILQTEKPAQYMPPPKTPQIVRKREIPSSQSPADSPLSTQSRTPLKDSRRSPLKDRSTNQIISTATPSRVPRWAKKLEVADSFENAENESISTNPPSTVKKGKAPGMSPQTSTYRGFDESVRSEPAAVAKSTVQEILDSDQGPQMGANIGDVGRPNFIEDSEAEDDEESDKAQPNATAIITYNHKHRQNPLVPANQHEKSPPTAIESINANPTNPSTHPTAFPNSSISRIKSTPTPDPHSPHPETNNPSAQLHNDLHLATNNPGMLQTESQFENGWSSYHRPRLPTSTSPLSDPPLSASIEEVPSSAPHERSQQQQAMLHNTIPTQIISSSSPTAPIQFQQKQKSLVPPSQATTTDGTQSSPTTQRKITSSSSIQMPSSPPPMPPPLASPTERRGKGEDFWKGFEWDGVRLTDSQLLPESLLNDSVGGLPVGIGCEEELEEE